MNQERSVDEKEVSAVVSAAQNNGRPAEIRASAASDQSFSQQTLDFGFRVAILLAGFCLVVSVCYLVLFLLSTNNGIVTLVQEGGSKQAVLGEKTLQLAIAARLAMSQIALYSCGVLGGIAFGCLGFGLFLIGARGEMDSDMATPSESFRIKVARISPGVFVILCATLLIAYCSTRGVALNSDPSEKGAASSPVDKSSTSPSQDRKTATDPSKQTDRSKSPPKDQNTTAASPIPSDKPQLPSTDRKSTVDSTPPQDSRQSQVTDRKATAEPASQPDRAKKRGKSSSTSSDSGTPSPTATPTNTPDQKKTP